MCKRKMRLLPQGSIQVLTFLIVSFLIVKGELAYGQLNLKMGYTLNYTQSNVNNNLLDAYNSNNKWLSQEFKNLRFLNGIHAGLRYKKDFIAIDLHWERVFSEKESFGVNQSGNAVSNELNYSFNRYGLGLELYNNFFGLGANTYYEQFNLKSPISGLDSDEKIITEGNFGNKVYLIFTSIGNERISVSLQPFAMIPWTESNLFNLETHLGLPSNQNTYNQRDIHFGISLIFYNGPQ